MNRAEWKGLAKLATEAVVHGSRAIERVQIATAARTFDVLDHVPVVAPVAGVVRVCHDGITSFTHASIRAVGEAVGGALAGLLDSDYSALGSKLTLSNESVTAPPASAPTSIEMCGRDRSTE